MTRFGVQLEKSVSFRGGTQAFSNTYYYEAAVAADNDAYLNDLLDDLIPLERAIHADNVTYVMGRVWSQLGTPAQNQMRIQRALSGSGSVATESVNMDKERAFLLQFRAGVDSRGRPVFLRKWLHLNVASIGGAGISNDMLVQNTQLTQAQRDAIVAFGDSIKTLTPGAGPNASLVAKGGRVISGGTSCHPYLEHHQLGDQWRGQ